MEREREIGLCVCIGTIIMSWWSTHVLCTAFPPSLSPFTHPSLAHIINASIPCFDSTSELQHTQKHSISSLYCVDVVPLVESVCNFMSSLPDPKRILHTTKAFIFLLAPCVEFKIYAVYRRFCGLLPRYKKTKQYNFNTLIINSICK